MAAQRTSARLTPTQIEVRYRSRMADVDCKVDYVGIAATGVREIRRRKGESMSGLLWIIIVVLVVLWIAGFAIHFGGGLIHLLLVIAVILLVYNLLTGRGARL